MSGHSKWHNIQQKKGKKDAQRANTFTKLARAITVATSEGGGDAETNFSLRLSIEKAKASNMPNDNIDRAIKRGTGELNDQATLEEIIYEGFLPCGVAFLIDAVTDNKNRTVSEVKHAFSQYGGSLGGPGSVQWQFKKKAVVRLAKETIKVITDWESVQLALMDIGVEDIEESKNGVELRGAITILQAMVGILEALGTIPDESGIEWVAKETVFIDDVTSKKVSALYNVLDELNDIRAVFTNEA